MRRGYIPTDGGPTSLPGPIGLNPSANAPTAAQMLGGGPDFPAIMVVAVEFDSDHKKKMTNKGFNEVKPDFTSGGTAFAQQATWEIDPSSVQEKSHPVSHTGNLPVTLIVTVELFEHEGPLKGNLTGKVIGSGLPTGMTFAANGLTFIRGQNKFRVKSNILLGTAIQKVQFTVTWRFTILGMTTVPGYSGKNNIFTSNLNQSTNELFVTLGEPLLINDKEITYGRLAHAVEKVGAKGTTDPHKLVEVLVQGQGFDGDISATHDAWFLAKNPKTNADCITIAKYITAIMQMIGLKGTIKAVIVYVRPKGKFAWHSLVPPDTTTFKGFPVPAAVTKIKLLEDVNKGDFEAVEGPAPSTNNELSGLDKPLVVHKNEPWHLRLMDNQGGQNRFEACVKFTDDKKKTKWYAAGTTKPGFEKLDKIVPSVFKSLSWVSGLSAVIKKHIEEF